jgi:thymidylate kinase
MEQENEEFYESVRRGFLHLASRNPARFAVIDGAGDEKSVEYAINKVIAERLQIPGGTHGIH